MIPDFNEHGYLPPGIYSATMDDVIQRFRVPRSIRRQELTDTLIRFIEFIEPFAINVFIDGGYITSKQSPKDVDLLVVLPDNFDKDSSEARRLRGFQANKKQYRLHIFPFRQTLQADKIGRRLDWFTQDRDSINKGIINIEMRQ
jgi:hypothetical protein